MIVDLPWCWSVAAENIIIVQRKMFKQQNQRVRLRRLFLSIRETIIVLVALIMLAQVIAFFLFVPDVHQPSADGLLVPRKQNRRSNGEQAKELLDEDHKKPVHIVFTTDCSGYQHWQGIALWYSAQAVGHEGPITRIATGCTEDQKSAIQTEVDQISAAASSSASSFHVHFTPSFALPGKQYKYSNKPGGLRHWLLHNNNATTTNDRLTNDTVVCLLDPDMLLLKPITSTIVLPTWNRRRQPPLQQQQQRRPQPPIEYVNPDNGIPQVLRAPILEEQVNNADYHHHDVSSRLVYDEVQKGHPAGQHFGVGGAWSRAGTSHARPVWQTFSKSQVCGSTHSPCVNTSTRDADTLYAVGPVYLAVVQDWYQIADTWWDFVPRMHEQYPHLLAEMYAMTMAVAHLELPFTLVSNYMISAPTTNSPTEAWSWIDSHLLTNNTSSDNNSSLICTLPESLPSVLHYCQRYNISGHFFSKRKMPHNFFSCGEDKTPFLPLDSVALQRGLGLNPSPIERRTAFMLCHIISILNAALVSYQRDVCS